MTSISLSLLLSLRPCLFLQVITKAEANAALCKQNKEHALASVLPYALPCLSSLLSCHEASLHPASPGYTSHTHLLDPATCQTLLRHATIFHIPCYQTRYTLRYPSTPCYHICNTA